MTPVKDRVPLTRDRILQTAVAVADAEGIEALSMRRLGQALGVEAMSLYNHVTNKDDVLGGMLDIVAAEIAPDPTAEGWRAVVRSQAVATHDALLRHPWAGLLWVTAPVGPARLRHMDTLLRSLRKAGFPPLLLDRAFHTILNHVIGHAIQRVNLPVSAGDMAEGAARFLATLDVQAYPDLAAHIRWHAGRPAGDDEFEFGLDLLLDGLARALADPDVDAGGPPAAG